MNKNSRDVSVVAVGLLILLHTSPKAAENELKEKRQHYSSALAASMKSCVAFGD